MGETAGLEPRPGVLLGGGRYRLDQLIGSGGMATVWRATDRRLGRTVAIKLISDALADDPTYAERFAREARTAAGLSHTNLVQVFDYGAGDLRPYLVMEYVDGGTLAQRLERGPVVGEEAGAVAGDLLAALGCIHAAGILHRDIKPANVLLSSDGRARITDFGIAHPEDSTRLTQTGHLVGTLRYLAPEVIDGHPPSRKSDLYALGVLLRDLSGGRGDATTDELVARLTDQIPARRPATAEQALRLVRRPPGGAGPPVRRRPRPPRTGAGTSRTRVLPGGLGRLGGAGLAAGRHRWQASRPGAAGPRPAGRIAAIAGAGVVLVVAAIVLGTSGGTGGSPRRGATGAGGAANPAATSISTPATATSATGISTPATATSATGISNSTTATSGSATGTAGSGTSRPATGTGTGTAGLAGRLDELERLVRAAGQP
ncbi:MAG: eukaryotic-like serine/threonine-protein kinase [Solirubrobacteraceae bacterium]|nr:eukaryotic-like serine/threonine-protein kinase [Solirubrobacteraceae bacterium]